MIKARLKRQSKRKEAQPGPGCLLGQVSCHELAASQSVRGRYPHTRFWHNSLNARELTLPKSEVALDTQPHKRTVIVQPAIDKDIAMYLWPADRQMYGWMDGCTDGL